MSFTSIPARTNRLNRSELAVPGSNPRFIEKAARSSADVIFFDLEDSVSPDQKMNARRNVIEALHDLDFGDKSISVRINGLDTQYMYRDVVELVEQAGHLLDMILVPKVGCAADIYAVDMLLTQIETAKGINKRIGIEILIETPLGLCDQHPVVALSAADGKLLWRFSAGARIDSPPSYDRSGLLFGSADYAASTGAKITMIGGPNPDYHVLTDADANGVRHSHWGDMWHYAIAKLVSAARANGVRPVDGPFADIRDKEGWLASARRAMTLGCEGKMVIHPSQVDLANELFAPSSAEVTQAERILEAMAAAERDGMGAMSLDGRMIDIASIRQAEVTVNKAKQIAATRVGL